MDIRKEPIYQTLDEFVSHPFNSTGTVEVPGFKERKNELEKKYQVAKKDIMFTSSTEFDGSYFLHIKIPSKSSAGNYHDVVVQFFTSDKNTVSDDSIYSYVIQFFSNSPGFIYRYAALYRIHGYMIDAFQEKLDPIYASKLPEKTNKDFIIIFDKSIYFACRYIQDNRLVMLSKSRLHNMKRVSLRELVNSISSVSSPVRNNNSNVESDVRKENRSDKKKLVSHMRRNVSSTLMKHSSSKNSKKTSVTNTSKNVKSSIVTPKKRGSKTMSTKKQVL